MDWTVYPIITYLTTAFLAGGMLLIALKKQPLLRNTLLVAGVLAMSVFAAGLWIELGRPPMRTLAETRLWYSVFLAFTGLILYYRWKMPWMLYYSMGMTLLFLFINLGSPDTYDETLMPALQSPWFVPHVIVYIIGYALLAASSLMGLHGLWTVYNRKSPAKILEHADNVVYIGFAFLTFGLLFGALWAKEAWGHYWTWDPKETWAFLTWFMYLIYIHIRYKNPKKHLWALWTLTLAFVILLITWFGVNYLPTAADSVHTYTS